jgi:hypothetical protein
MEWQFVLMMLPVIINENNPRGTRVFESLLPEKSVTNDLQNISLANEVV